MSDTTAAKPLGRFTIAFRAPANYNYGDAEVTMMFWFLMGLALVLAGSQTTNFRENQAI